ncbi:MAG: hypothetical protein PPP56_01800 [Longimonas sp.]|uniref:hypothetical protein n=1 Tax=Longimonas sp. TaxID=2039626 RepID=UPI00334B30A0
MSVARYFSPSAAFAVLIGVSMLFITAMLFTVDTMLGFASIMVFVGSAFVYSAMELADRTTSNKALITALRVRAIGLVLIGLGTFFGALMYLVF